MRAMSVCKDCGKSFVYTYIGQKRTVCNDCKRTHSTLRKRAYRAMESERQAVETIKRKKRSVTTERIIAAANRASELGITYGKYMGRDK